LSNKESSKYNNNTKKKPIVPMKIPISTNVGETLSKMMVNNLYEVK
jgi:hypothetical protein